MTRNQKVEKTVRFEGVVEGCHYDEGRRVVFAIRGDNWGRFYYLEGEKTPPILNGYYVRGTAERKDVSRTSEGTLQFAIVSDLVVLEGQGGMELARYTSY